MCDGGVKVCRCRQVCVCDGGVKVCVCVGAYRYVCVMEV